MEKVKVLANRQGIEEQIKEKVGELKEDAYKKAITLVGGIVTTGQGNVAATSAGKLREQKTNEMSKYLIFIVLACFKHR